MTHTSTEQPELLPCPFCGTNPTLEGDGEILWIVCHADSACRRGGMAFAIKKDEMETGIASWNRRAPAAQAQRAPLKEDAIRILYGESDGHWQMVAPQVIQFARSIERTHGITQEKQE